MLAEFYFRSYRFRYSIDESRGQDRRHVTTAGPNVLFSKVLSGGPALLSHHRVVAQHLANGRVMRQQGQFLGRPRLELPAILDDRRARPWPATFRTDRRAAA
jgi:hypothetical protein